MTKCRQLDCLRRIVLPGPYCAAHRNCIESLVGRPTAAPLPAWRRRAVGKDLTGHLRDAA